MVDHDDAGGRAGYRADDELGDAYDVVVVGGGAAGLNGALMLARSRRSVAVVDAGDPRNSPAAGVHGLLGREGMAPGELLARGRAEVRGYGGHVVTGTVADVSRDGPGFVVRLAGGRTTRARRLLLTTGLVDELPAVPGLRERWGRDVLHCPYCHGWEVRDQAVGVLASGPMSVHQALLFRQLTPDVTYFRQGSELADEQREELLARDVQVVDEDVVEVLTEEDRLTGVRLADGSVLARDAVAVATRMVARGDLLTALDLTTTTHPMGVGEYVATELGGRTSAQGVWAAGNVTDLVAQVGAAAAGGAMAGAQINADLVAEETRLAVQTRRVQQVATA